MALTTCARDSRSSAWGSSTFPPRACTRLSPTPPPRSGPSPMAAEARFDFGFIPSGPVAETVALVRSGEELGYRCAWIPDQGFHRDPFSLLTAAAQATTNIGLGVGVTTPFTRLPLQIARAAATVDEFAQGRLKLGLG